MQNSPLLFCFLVFTFWVAVINCSGPVPDKDGFYELKRGDFSVKFTTWGARIVSLVVPDKNGKLEDIVLGYDSAADYQNDQTNFGAIVGRVANRIGGARFTLNGTVYKLDANSGNNTLHGGAKGYSHVAWKVKKYDNKGSLPYITFGYHSFDGEEGFPGNLHAYVTYTLSGLYELSVDMRANHIDKATPVNLAHHSYWNLGGQNSGNILSNQIQIFGSHITPVDKNLVPTGEKRSVKHTPYNFLKPASIATMMKNLTGGYDINYALDVVDGNKTKELKNTEELKKAAIVFDKKSGRVMEVSTNQPGMQFYTANTLNVKGKGGFVYQPHAALCLETQGYPDAVNHPNFPSQIVTPGNVYVHKMKVMFSARS